MLGRYIMAPKLLRLGRSECGPARRDCQLWLNAFFLHDLYLHAFFLQACSLIQNFLLDAFQAALWQPASAEASSTKATY
eukprot:74891-Chlamydomonas_euryale.AAC.2